MENKKTISEALGSRVANFAETANLKTLIERTAVNTLFLLACFALLSPGLAFSFLLRFCYWQECFVLKAAAVWLLTFRWKMLRGWYYKLAKKIQPKNQQLCYGIVTKLYHGIPSDELLAFLFDHCGFPVKEFCAKFGVTVHNHGKIAKMLNEKNIILKGNFNAWRLNDDLTREYVVRILNGETVRVCTYEEKPVNTKAELKERILFQTKALR